MYNRKVFALDKNNKRHSMDISIGISCRSGSGSECTKRHVTATFGFVLVNFLFFCVCGLACVNQRSKSVCESDVFYVTLLKSGIKFFF